MYNKWHWWCGISNENKANVNDDNNAGLVQGNSAKNDQFENIDDDQINSDENALGTSKSSSSPKAKKQRVKSSNSSGDNDNDEEEVATPQHGGGHVAVDNCAGCRHVWTLGRPVHQWGLHRRGGVCIWGGGGRVPVCSAVPTGRGRGDVAGGDAWTWKQVNVGEQVQMEDFQFNENEGLKVRIKDNPQSIDFVEFYFTETLLQLIITEKNRYAEQYVEANSKKADGLQ